LERNDYLRAALYGFEAYLTKQIQNDPAYGVQAVDSYTARKDKQKELDDNRRFRSTAEGKAYLRLRNLRNSMAHGDQNKVKEIQRAMSTAQELAQVLAEDFALLLKD